MRVSSVKESGAHVLRSVWHLCNNTTKVLFVGFFFLLGELWRSKALDPHVSPHCKTATRTAGWVSLIPDTARRLQKIQLFTCTHIRRQSSITWKRYAGYTHLTLWALAGTPRRSCVRRCSSESCARRCRSAPTFLHVRHPRRRKINPIM